jgi:hypothetical protein
MDIWEDTVTDILAEKEKTHGKFEHTAVLSQDLKEILHQSDKWYELTREHREAIDCICVKLARIASGNANEPDHWLDIAGYAALGRRSSGDVH